MLLPVLTTPSSTSIPQSQAVEAKPKSANDGEKVEPSSFEDAILWFQIQTATIENRPLTPLEIDLESSQIPSAEIVSTENLPVVLGEESRAEFKLEKLPQQQIDPIELQPQQSSSEFTQYMLEDDGELAAPELQSQKIISLQSDSQSFLEKAELTKLEIEPDYIPPEAQHEAEVATSTEAQAVDHNSTLSQDPTASSISEALQPASKTVQSVTQQVAEQTMAQIANNSNKQDSSFTVRLDPPELGEVLVSLKKSEGGIIMRVSAIEKTTQALLQLNELDLSQAMTEHQGDVTMEFGSQSDFESSMFSEQNEFVTQRHSTSRQQATSTQSNSPQNSSSIKETLHNFTA